MKAIVIERQKMVRRRMNRFLIAAGFEPVIVEEPAEIESHIVDAQLLICDAFDGDLLVSKTREHPGLRGLLITAEPINRCLRHVVENPRISHVLGRLNFDSAPRPWELLMILKRMFRPGKGDAELRNYLGFGYTTIEFRPGTNDERDEVVARVQSFVDSLALPKRVGEGFAELAHELLMNAMYDAPVDAAGSPKYAMDRKQQLNLPDEEKPVVVCGTDGDKLLLRVTDPFGRLERKHVFAGLARGLAGGEMDRSHGGAGLGMMVCHNSTAGMFYEVVRNKRTTATGFFDLDANLREFRKGGRSLHYFESEE
ncbi:MAG: hypothetical protein KJO07_12835 [Deltaproteobacteria bacterium]|jgi:hypothetical protein|nr:hypothetical protein [Deltaproteobacteria bacterium]